jgi:Leucine rich repeat variant
VANVPSPAQLSVLAADEIRPVRLWVARNPNTPPEALDALAQDADSAVRWNVLLNPSTPATALETTAVIEEARFGSRGFTSAPFVRVEGVQGLPHRDPAFLGQVVPVTGAAGGP